MFLHTAIASNVTVTNYTDAGLGNGTTYYYVVTAPNPGDESTNSLQASATTIGSAPRNSAASQDGREPYFQCHGWRDQGSYYLLASTNIAMSFSNWTRLLTNQFDNSGNFNFTNAMNPDSPQNFYRLQLP